MAHPDKSSVYLDPAEAAAAQRARRHKFHTEDVPRLRLIGFAFNALGVVVHNWLIFHVVDWTASAQHAAVLLGYALFAWVMLAAFWDRVRVVNLGDVFFGLDLFPMAYVVYVTGANESLMWFVFAARAADQVAISFRNSVVFSHLATLAYAGLMVWVSFGEGRPVDWSTEAAKIVFLYILCLYITLSARSVADRRRKFDSARRMAEQAVRDAEDRRRDLEHAMTRLEAANRTKTEFLANVSHEVRTPLNSVIGNADLLLDTPLSRDQREMLGVMRDSAESLTRIVDDILDLSKMEAQRLPLESIPLRVREVAGTTIKMFAARAHQKGLTLVCHVQRDVPEVVLGDPHRLRQILTNIVNNAIKFTERGDVTLHVEVDDTHDGRVALRFSVHDTGVGIPKSRQHAIFEAFTQADGSDTRRYGGTGLGLTIAAQLVALMQGRLWVDSEEGQGSTFRFVAWFGASPARQSTPPWGEGPLHILVAHGHAISRSALVELLAPWPTIRTSEAAGGRAAMAAMEVAQGAGQPFDVVFADAALTGLDGFELAARAKATPGLARDVVVLLPTTQLTTGAERALALGVRYLALPVIWASLADALSAITSGRTEARVSSGGRRLSRRALRILVADDHVVNQAVVSAVLRKWGHAVATALDGQEAVDKSAREPFDLVLMDLQMPELDGLQATRQIRAREVEHGTPRLPIIAMTARAMTEDRDRCLEAGMDGFITKPLDQHDLFEQLEVVGRTAITREAPQPETSVTPLISDPGISHHVAGLFLDTAPGQLDRLRRAVDARDGSDVTATAHSLRGAMSHFTGARLEHLERLEDAGRQNRLDDAPAILARVEADVADVLALLASRRDLQ
jgi:signal transduction histidine kinase/DNA-binding response OmpR family regulator